MGRGFSEILSGELEGSPQRYAIQSRTLHSFDILLGRRPEAPGISAESTDALVAGANQVVYGDFAVIHGILRATATEEDLHTRKMLRVAVATGAGIFPVAESLARQLGVTQPFGTRNPEALRGYVAGLESPDPAAASRDFASAVAADAGFGRAYLAGVETAAAQHNGAEAERLVARAGAHRNQLTALDRAGLDFDAAALRGNFPAELEARRQLARLDPANPDRHRALAEMLMSLRDYDAAIAEFRRGLSIRPDDVVALNMMGYAAAYSGDLPTATRVLRGYELLRPADPNPLDSLGDAHFALGHFGEAEQFYLAANTKSPAFSNNGELLKAAQARLMTGDVRGATALLSRFQAARQAAGDSYAPGYAAEWSWQTGARREAVAAMDRLSASTSVHEVSSRADAQAAIWLVALGDRAGALAHARKAASEALPATAQLASLAASLEQPEAPAPSGNGYVRLYWLLLNKQFQSAVPLLEEIRRRPSNDLDDSLDMLLAWACEETGDWRRAEPLLRLTPLPQAAGLPVLGVFYFPRLFRLRGAMLDHEGHHTEATRYFQMFHQLSGPDGMVWGEEQSTR